MKKVGIYKITSPTGKIYIGQSWDLEDRLHRYTCDVQKHKGQVKLYSSLCKYGTVNHKSEVLLELPTDITQKVLDDYEIFFIAQYKESGHRMLNLQEGGRGGKHSEESKLKMSVSHTGKTLSQESIEKTRSKNLGKKRSEEFKQRLSELVTGRTHSDEAKQKISEAKKEFFKTNQVHNKGVKLHEEGRKILSDASTCKKPVLQFTRTGEFVKEWDFIKEVADYYSISSQGIIRVCKGGRPTAANFIWKYKE